MKLKTKKRVEQEKRIRIELTVVKKDASHKSVKTRLDALHHLQSEEEKERKKKPEGDMTKDGILVTPASHKTFNLRTHSPEGGRRRRAARKRSFQSGCQPSSPSLSSSCRVVCRVCECWGAIDTCRAVFMWRPATGNEEEAV